MPRFRSKSYNNDEDVKNTTDPEMLAEIEYGKRQLIKSSSGAGDSKTTEPEKMQRTKSDEGPERERVRNGFLSAQKNNGHSHRGRILPRGPDEPRKQSNIPRGVEEEAYLDENDPNYDSDAQVNITFEELDPELGVEELEKHAQPVMKEYFYNGDIREALDSIKEFNMSVDSRSALIRLGISLSLDGKTSCRELMSQLIMELVQRRVLGEANVEKAFKDLLDADLPDLIIDYPSAAETVGNFLARAIADLTVSTAFLEDLLKDKDGAVANPQTTAALDRAETLMKQKSRLHDVWGVGGGLKPVRFLTRQMQLLLQEYLSSQDSKEAERCLRELEVPHFHHEIVYQAGVMSIEMMHDRISERLANLLKSLSASGVLTVDAIDKGFQRLLNNLSDLCLDVPPAYTLAERWVAVCEKTGLLPDGIKQKVPHRGRKRYVSEGDGGRLKVLDIAHPLI